MRLQQAGRILDDLRPERQLASHVQLRGQGEQRDVGLFGQPRMSLAGRRLKVDQPGMRVLRVVDGILVALGDRQLEVELDRRVRRAQEVEVPHGIRADPVDQFVEGDEAPGALGHFH